LQHEQVLLAEQLSATRHTLSVSRRALEMSLRSLYKRGDVSTLAVVLGSRSLDDAVSELDVLSSAADESHQIVRTTTKASTRIARLQQSIEVRRIRLGAMLTEARRDASALESARAERLAFISRLELRAQQLTDLQAAASRVERRSNELQAAALVPVVASLGGRTITVSATGYSLAGRTATGMPVGWGVVAVDPGLIPLGTKLTIPGYGDAVAADTGSGVRGGAIDLWFPTLAQARAWGRRTVSVTLH
jgi:3D (Asp-Asp-Asp) domain-containing protein